MQEKKLGLTDRVTLAMNSLGFVIIAMVATKTMQLVFSHNFYAGAFPTMEKWEAIGSTWSLAFGWECALLIVTMNPDHIKPWLRNVLVIASGVNMLFFIDAFNPNITGAIFYGRLFIGVISTSIDLVYITIVGKKWNERKFMKELPEMVVKLKADLQQALAQVLQLTARDQQTTADLQKATAEVLQLRAKVQQNEEELKCPLCGEMQPSRAALNTHKGRYCSQRKQKEGVQINGHSYANH